MHQSHNIAWDSLSLNLVFIHENRKITPHRTDLFARRLPSQGTSLTHFARTLTSTIREFSDTERAKYPAKFSGPTDGPLFSDALLARYCNLPFPSVTEPTQRIEHWISRVYFYGNNPEPQYNTGQGDLADVVKVLLSENELETLLMLAQHPHVPLAHLHSLSWGHSFGWDHVCDWALWAYLFFNVLLSKPDLIEDGRYKSMRSYKYTVRHATGSGDFDAQSFQHRKFFFGTMDRWGNVEEADPLGNYDKLHDYLKMCFRLLYRYDMLARECGIDVEWDQRIAQTLGSLWDLKIKYEKDEQDNWVTRFA